MLINFVWNLLKLMPCSLEICHFINVITLQSIKSAIFNSHLSYARTVWGQSIPISHRICILQRNALRIICFAKFNIHTTHLFRRIKIIRFADLVSVENCIFINKCFSCKSCSVFSQTRFAVNGLLIQPNYNTAKFGTKAFLYSTITFWNSVQALF